MENLLYLGLAIAAGVCTALQTSINTALSRAVGSLESSLVSFVAGTILLLVIVLIFGRGQMSLITTVPKWQLIGGFLGAFLVFTTIIATPKLGVVLVVTGIMLGQLVMSMIIDNFGLLQTPAVPLNPWRIVGIILIAIGVLCVYKSKMGIMG